MCKRARLHHASATKGPLKNEKLALTPKASQHYNAHNPAGPLPKRAASSTSTSTTASSAMAWARHAGFACATARCERCGEITLCVGSLGTLALMEVAWPRKATLPSGHMLRCLAAGSLSVAYMAISKHEDDVHPRGVCRQKQLGEDVITLDGTPIRSNPTQLQHAASHCQHMSPTSVRNG